MSNIQIIYDEKSPLIKELKNSSYPVYNEKNCDILVDFTTCNKNEKKKLLSTIKAKKIISDLSFYDPQEFYNEYPKLKACFSSFFITEKRKIEIYYKEFIDIKSIFNSLETELIEIKQLSSGFIYPRIFAQIVNEAYFALGEGVASSEDIDRAMKFGVNYPFGPFEWSKGKETYIVRLLKELKNKTQDERYDIAPLLQNFDL